MKKILLTLFIGFLMMACSKSSNSEEPTPVPENDKISFASGTNLSPTFDVEGGTVSISFTTSKPWTASLVNNRADGWCKVEPASGPAGTHSISIKVSQNEEPYEKSAVVQIKSGNATETINVSQKQKNTLTLTSNKYEVDSKGGSIEIEIKSNIKYSYSITDKAKEWIAYESSRALTTSYLNFKISPNESLTAREGTITISDGVLSETVTIYQQGEKPSIIISQKEYTIGADANTIQVEVSSNVDVEIQMPNVDWIAENQSRAYSTNTYHFIVSTNETYDNRNAEIIFKNTENNLEEKVVINQMQRNAIVLAKNEYTLEKEACHLDFDIQANVAFEVKVEGEWIKQVQSRGLGSHSLYFDVAENTGDDEREGKIFISSGDIEQVIKVIQRGKKMNVELLKVYSDSIKNYILNIGANIEYSVFKKDFENWLKLQDFVKKCSSEENDNHIIINIDYNFDVKHEIVFLKDVYDSENINSRSSIEDFFDVSSQSGETIMAEDDLDLLCLEALPEYYFSSAKGVFENESSNSPVNLTLRVESSVRAMDLFSKYGTVLITMTHGSISDFFCVSYNDDNLDYLQQKIGDKVDFSKCKKDLYWTVDDNLGLKWKYAEMMPVHLQYLLPVLELNDSGIIMGAYCYSAINRWMCCQGNFIGVKNTEKIWGNKANVRKYFNSLFNGKTHEEAFQIAYANNDNLVTNNKRPKQRYFSISTEDVDSLQNVPVIKGRINGYNNLKKEVKYKVYYDSQEFDSPSYAKYSIEVTPNVAGDIGIALAKLEPLSSYYYCIGMEYEGKYYYGEIKNYMLQTTNCPITLDATDVKSTSAVLNAKVNGWKSLIAKFGFCYSKDNDTPDVNNGIIHGEIVKSIYDDVDVKFNSVVLDTLEPGTTYYYRSYIYLYNNGQYVYGDVKSFTTTIEDPQNIAEAVDLGLSVLWASHNVGATKPEEYGGYYAWGETEEKKQYALMNYKFYNMMTGGMTDLGKKISGTKYDVAKIKWGDGWRMPTANEMLELTEQCEWTDTVCGTVKGKKITGKNENSIFLPAVGAGAPASEVLIPNKVGLYWTGELDESCLGGVNLFFEYDWTVLIDVKAGASRWYGLPVRPVKDK